MTSLPNDITPPAPLEARRAPTGIGVDIVDVARLERSLRRSSAFAAEVFSDDERRYCECQKRPLLHYAARFAAKEALLKALGIGVLSGVSLLEIEVVRDAKGRPAFRLGDSASAALARAGGAAPLLSLSHDGPCAIAFVVVP